MRPTIFLLPATAVGKFLREHGVVEGSATAAGTLSREDCGNILFDHERLCGEDTPAGAYCPETFQDLFNHATAGDAVSSSDYYIRIFPN